MDDRNLNDGHADNGADASESSLGRILFVCFIIAACAAGAAIFYHRSVSDSEPEAAQTVQVRQPRQSESCCS